MTAQRRRLTAGDGVHRPTMSTRDSAPRLRRVRRAKLPDYSRQRGLGCLFRVVDDGRNLGSLDPGSVRKGRANGQSSTSRAPPEQRVCHAGHSGTSDETDETRAWAATRTPRRGRCRSTADASRSVPQRGARGRQHHLRRRPAANIERRPSPTSHAGQRPGFSCAPDRTREARSGRASCNPLLAGSAGGRSAKAGGRAERGCQPVAGSRVACHQAGDGAKRRAQRPACTRASREKA
jgi:hypothetical protein